MTSNGSDIAIQITADAKKAISAIDDLIGKIQSLSAVLSGLETSKTSTLSKSIQDIADATKGLDKNSVENIKKVGEALSSVSNSSESVQSATDNIKQLSTEASSAEKPLSNISNALQGGSLSNMASSIQTVSEKFSEMSPKIDGVSEKLSGLKGKLVNLRVFINTKSMDETQRKIEKLKDQYEQLHNAISKKRDSDSEYVDSKSFERDVAKLQGIRNEYDRLKEKQIELSREGGYKPNTKGFEKFAQSLKIIKGNIDSVLKKIGSLGKKMLHLDSATKIARKSTQAFSTASKNLSKQLLRTAKMLRLMLVRMALREVIDEVSNGFKSLALHSEDFNSAVSRLSSGAKQLGYSFSAMVSPIIEALAPALEYLIGLLIKLLNIINQVFSAIAGKTTWNKAKGFSDDFAQSVKDANKSAKELKKTVLGFDELNQLQDKTTSGGDTSKNITDMYETEDIEKRWKDLAQWLKDMWDKGDFYELGKKLGEQFKAWLDAIPWDEIRDTSNKLGKCLATFINGLVEVEGLGRSIGTTIAQSLNTVFEFVNGFVHNLHWSSIGKFIAETFNGFFEGIDWELIRDTFVTGFTGFADSIWAFIKNFNWDNISKTIANAVNTITESIYKFFTKETYDDRGFKQNGTWLSRLGTELGSQLRKTIEEIDWKQLGQTLGTVVQNAINFVKNFLAEQDFESIKNAISDLVEGFFEEVDKEELAKVIASIVGASIVLSIPSILSKVVSAKIGEAVLTKAFASAVGSKAVEGAVGESVSGALLGTASAPTAPLVSACATLGTALGALVAGNFVIDKTGSIWEKAILSGMESAGYDKADIDAMKKNLDDTLARYDGIKGKLNIFKDGYEEVKKAIKGTTDEVQNTGIVVENLTEKTKNSSIRVENLIDANKSAVKQNSSALSESEKSTSSYGKSIDIVVEKTTKLSDKLKSDKAIPTYSKDGQDAFLKLQKSADDIKFEKIIQGAQTMKTQAGASFNETQNKVKVMKESIELETANLNVSMEGKVQQLTQTVSNGTKAIEKDTDTLKQSFDEKHWTLDGIKKGLTASFEGAIQAIKEIWNRFANALNEKLRFTIEPIVIMGKTVYEGGTLDLGKIPTFATGGFPEDGLFMANHNEMVGQFSNGRTAVANNEQIISGIKQGVYEAVAMAMSNSNGNNSGQYINNTIQIDGETIARAVTRGQNSLSRRYSPTTT